MSFARLRPREEGHEEVPLVTAKSGLPRCTETARGWDRDMRGCRPVSGNDDLVRWFGHVDLTEAPSHAESVAIELVRMLDAVQPARLDRRRSVVRVNGQGQTAEAEFLLAHVDGEYADLLLEVDTLEATIHWLTMHEHVMPQDGSEDRPWTVVVIDAVAAILRGEYEVEEVRKRGRLVKSRLIDRSDGRVLSVTGGLFAWLLPGRSEVGPRGRLDFGCRR